MRGGSTATTADDIDSELADVAFVGLGELIGGEVVVGMTIDD